MKQLLAALVCWAVITNADCETLKKQKLLVVINNENQDHHISFAKLSRSYIYGQLQSVRGRLAVEVVISTEHWPDLYGSWTFLPLLKEISDHYSEDKLDWLLIVSEHTEVNLSNLLPVLEKFDAREKQFIGHALQDSEMVIIHHFSDSKLLYPDTSCGVLLSWKQVISTNHGEKEDFNIDAKYELASYFYNNGEGITLTHVPVFCSPEVQDVSNCATHYKVNSHICLPSSSHKAVTDDDIFVMVKTGAVFHDSRVILQKKLWVDGVKHKEICSELEDKSIPTVKIDAPNTKQGHCAKFHAMLKRAYKEKHIRSKSWLVIVDDDTMMNVTRLAKLLTCYGTEKPIVLGERYGYMSHKEYGYDYVTGGGGTVFNMKAVDAIMRGEVSCSREDAPDDMTIGVWLKALGIPIVHSPLFHQAPPQTYPVTYLQSQKDYTISFHKFQPQKPEQICTDWLGLKVQDKKTPILTEHTEL